MNFVVLVLSVLNSSDVKRGSVRENQTIGFLKKKKESTGNMNKRTTTKWRWMLRLHQQPKFQNISNTHQPFVPCINDSVKHGLVEQTIAHPLRDDNVYFLHRKLNLLHLSFNDGNNWIERGLWFILCNTTNEQTQANTWSFSQVSYRDPTCWPSQSSQHSLIYCCTQSAKQMTKWI